jgi:hypothetical protein
MNTELTLLIPDSLLQRLERKARVQGVSTEALCLSLLLNGVEEENTDLVNPTFYKSLSCASAREELLKVIRSPLPTGEIKDRVTKLEFEISRRYRK